MASSSTPEWAEELLWSLGVGENLPKWLKESRKRATMPTLNEKKDQIAGRIGWQESSFNLGNMSVSPDGPSILEKPIPEVGLCHLPNRWTADTGLVIFLRCFPI